MKKSFLICLMMMGVMASGAVGAMAASAKATPAQSKQESPEVIKKKLDDVGTKLVASAARSVTPAKSAKAVAKDGKAFVATYVEVDTTSLSTEVRPASGAGGSYVGVIRYLENHYECRGETKPAALSGPCEMVKSRRMNELIRYDGKWVY